MYKINVLFSDKFSNSHINWTLIISITVSTNIHLSLHFASSALIMFEWKKWGNASFLQDLSTVAYMKSILQLITKCKSLKFHGIQACQGPSRIPRTVSFFCKMFYWLLSLLSLFRKTNHQCQLFDIYQQKVNIAIKSTSCPCLHRSLVWFCSIYLWQVYFTVFNKKKKFILSIEILKIPTGFTTCTFIN